MSIKKEVFGHIDNKTVSLYILTNSSGNSVRITDYGCIITAISIPDKNGNLIDIALGFDNLDDYLKEHPYFGAAIGRVGNRIAKSSFELNGKTHFLAANNGLNHLHGGLTGFDKVLWDSNIKGDDLVLIYLSPDGEEGYPGNLDVSIIYSFSDENELSIKYSATCDQDTAVNLTNHSYFNLNGEGADTILDQYLTINADHFLPTYPDNIPTGEQRGVAFTVFDFRERSKIGEKISNQDEQLDAGGGYDHNYILNSSKGNLALAATVESETSGIKMDVYTTEPGVQLYSGNHLDGSLSGKSGRKYKHRSGFCLETQKFPDAIHFPTFPDIVLKKGDLYTSETIYKFLK